MSLSHNNIESLKPFKNCSSLEELYLRKNKIENLSEIQFLKELRNLKVLWLWDNPCSEHGNYRLYVIKVLPTLEKLDNLCVTTEERQQAKKLTDSQMQECEETKSAGFRETQMDERKPGEAGVIKKEFIKQAKGGDK